ncbi:hypothetical protein [Escherichia coli]|uniref:hypothetical protein n=1 Tax=Escherichia coli TaxID=562 RepID=UPI003AAED8E6
MVASQLARHPLLLDELLDPNTLYQPTATHAYHRDESAPSIRCGCRNRMKSSSWRRLRQFKQAQQLHIAAADIAGTLPVMKVSDHLTSLAQAILDAVVQQAWGQMAARYGLPTHLHDRQGAPAPPSSATVGSAVGSWATAPISTWCSSMTARRR